MIKMLVQYLLPAIIGGLITGAATLGADRKRRKVEKSRLRRALSVEIQSTSARIQTLLERADGNHLPEQLSTETDLPTEVYQQNLGSIGQLTEKEIIAVLEYYQNVSGLKNSLKNHREAHKGEQNPATSDIRDGDMIMFWEFSVELRIQDLYYQQKAALHILSDD